MLQMHAQSHRRITNCVLQLYSSLHDSAIDSAMTVTTSNICAQILLTEENTVEIPRNTFALCILILREKANASAGDEFLCFIRTARIYHFYLRILVDSHCSRADISTCRPYRNFYARFITNYFVTESNSGSSRTHDIANNGLDVPTCRDS